MVTSIEQARASFALKQIQSIANGDSGNYVSYVSAMPAQIYMNGLGQTLAAMLAAAGRQKALEKDAHYLICQHLTDWLDNQTVPSQISPKEPVQLVQALMSSDQKSYMAAQVESLAFLDWLKKFARALLPEKNDDQPTNPQSERQPVTRTQKTS